MRYRFMQELHKEPLLKKLIAAALILSATAANATDWVELDKNKELSVYVDRDRIAYANQHLNYRTAWIKLKYNQPSGKFQTGEYSLANQVLDCNNSRFMVKTVTEYKKNGSVKNIATQNSGWLDVPPDSNFEDIYYAICDYPDI